MGNNTATKRAKARGPMLKKEFAKAKKQNGNKPLTPCQVKAIFKKVMAK